MVKDDGSYVVYVGCYTLPNQADPFHGGEGGGIPHDDRKVGTGVTALQLSKTTGKLDYYNPKQVATGITNPSYLTVIREKSLLCVTSEVEEGKVYAFSLDPNNPEKLDSMVCDGLTTYGAFPCHVSSFQSPTGDTFVMVSNYGNENGGVVAQFQVTPQTLIPKTATPHGKHGSRGDVARQMETHAHCCVAYSNTNVICSDLGADELVQYHLQEENDCLDPSGRTALPTGSGPRSIAFSPTDPRIAIVSLEMAAQIQLVKVQEHYQCLQLLGDPISILPQDWPLQNDDAMRKLNEGRWASDAVWSLQGDFVFAAARLHNHISVFRWHSERNELLLLHRVATNGITPRCLALSPCGNILLVAHQHSHDVSSFLVNTSSGMLTMVDKIEVPLVSCVCIFDPTAT